jgi:hypothetical protein
MVVAFRLTFPRFHLPTFDREFKLSRKAVVTSHVNSLLKGRNRLLTWAVARRLF